jgi:putative ABC transport system substrate-binding protein
MAIGAGGVATLALAVLVSFAASVSAQQAEQPARVAFLSGGPFAPGLLKTLEAALAEAGWRADKNLVIEYRSAEGHYDRLPGLVDEMLRFKPHVILSNQTPTTHAIRKVTSTIPIVMVGHGDPVRYGLVTSRARPDNNLTGISFNVNEVGVKLLDLLKEAAPQVRRVGFFVNPENAGAAPLIEAARAAAPHLGLVIRPAEVSSVGTLEEVLAALAREGVDALCLGPEAFIIANRQRILDFARAHRLPAVGGTPSFAHSGALMTYSAHWPSIVRAAARYTDRLLRGVKAADLPIEQPDRFELIVNARSAKALGLTLSPALLARVDQLIE